MACNLTKVANHSDDLDWIKRVQQKDDDALKLLYERYAPSLVGIISGIVRCHDTTSDIIQDIFLQLWEKSERFDPQRGKFASWLFTVARHRAIDQARRQKKHGSTLHTIKEQAPTSQSSQQKTPDILQGFPWSEQRQALRNALLQIPTQQREILLCVYFKGFSHNDIAQQLKLPLGTVKTRLRLGLGHLRELMKQSEARRWM